MLTDGSRFIVTPSLSMRPFLCAPSELPPRDGIKLDRMELYVPVSGTEAGPDSWDHGN